MTCPVCGAGTKVNDTRHPDCETVRRVRKCLECGHRFVTIEMEEQLNEHSNNNYNNNLHNDSCACIFREGLKNERKEM